MSPSDTGDGVSALRRLPAVHRLLQHLPGLPHEAARRACQLVLDEERSRLLASPEAAAVSEAELIARIQSRVIARATPSLRHVLNATGVLLHTNLGRASLAPSALAAVQEALAGTTNLELDLETGRRGSRQAHVAGLLAELCGAEDALVVNNCASAVLLVLAGLCRDREAIVSRGELVEIGGGFRVPEVMAESGARLREVGTTNRTHLRDYEKALGPETGLLLKVHRSNFAILGHTAEVELEELAPLARKANVPLFFDAGSGSLVPMPWQTTFPEMIRQGASLVTASGDKTLGGPQAGLIFGEAQWIARLRSHPLARAIRADKATIAALEATLRLYRDGQADQIPVVAAVRASMLQLEQVGRGLLKARAWKRLQLQLIPTEAQLGGGSDPRAVLPSVALALTSATASAESLKQSLLRGQPAVLARASEDRCLLDLRSLQPQELPLLAQRLAELDQSETS